MPSCARAFEYALGPLSRTCRPKPLALLSSSRAAPPTALGASLEAALLRLAGGASSDAGPAARKGRGEAAQAALTSAAAEAATAVEHASTKARTGWGAGGAQGTR